MDDVSDVGFEKSMHMKDFDYSDNLESPCCCPVGDCTRDIVLKMRILEIRQLHETRMTKLKEMLMMERCNNANLESQLKKNKEQKTSLRRNSIQDYRNEIETLKDRLLKAEKANQYHNEEIEIIFEAHKKEYNKLTDEFNCLLHESEELNRKNLMETLTQCKDVTENIIEEHEDSLMELKEITKQLINQKDADYALLRTTMIDEIKSLTYHRNEIAEECSAVRIHMEKLQKDLTKAEKIKRKCLKYLQNRLFDVFQETQLRSAGLDEFLDMDNDKSASDGILKRQDLVQKNNLKELHEQEIAAINSIHRKEFLNICEDFKNKLQEVNYDFEKNIRDIQIECKGIVAQSAEENERILNCIKDDFNKSMAEKNLEIDQLKHILEDKNETLVYMGIAIGEKRSILCSQLDGLEKKLLKMDKAKSKYLSSAEEFFNYLQNSIEVFND